VKLFSRLIRLIRIQKILVRYGLDDLLFTIPWLYPWRFVNYFNPNRLFAKKDLPEAVRIRLAIEELGPIFIKAGQLLSTRRDLLPDDIAEQLALLQDRVPPFPGEIAKEIIATALGPLDAIFQDLDLVPLASASIAQVHAATLLNGQAVVVKVLRPQLEKNIRQDVDILLFFAKLAERYWAETRRFKPQQMVAEITQTLYEELDLLREGANGSQLRRNFLNSPLLYIPEIYWNYSTTNVLVMERITGIPINDIAALQNAGIDMKKLAERSIEVFFTQVFRDSFFHADLHPGNIFVSQTNPHEPQYILVDFGITGSLNTKDQRYLADNMLAFFKRDYQRVAELHVASGWLPPDTRIDLFEGAIRAVCEPIFERPLKDISFGQLLMRLFQTARRFNMNIQPQLILLQKTLLNIEGVGRQLYPELDLWTTASPYLEKWLKKQVGAKAFLRRIKDNLPYWSEKLPEIPGLIYDVLSESYAKNKFAPIPIPVVDLTKIKRRKFALGLGVAFLLSAVFILVAPSRLSHMGYGLAVVGAVFIILNGIIA
jgi:ubiquinone biosynthesis protein